MASMEAFESTLKDVVTAKRLSASKMGSLTEIALRCMKNDTQLVSTLFRTHKTLSPASKVNSLYVFDALARAAKNQVNKHRLTPPSDPTQGNCVTFMLKVEGILDSLWLDLLSTRDETLKEKSKKILDIWIKNNTFPSAALERLSQHLENSAKELEGRTAPPPPDPRSQPVPIPSTTPPQPPPAAADSGTMTNLINLLTKATNASAAANPSQIPTNIATSAYSSTAAPTLAADPLALIQQLAQAAGLANGVPAQPVPLPVSLVPSSSSATSAVPVVPPDRGPPQPPPYRNDDHYGFGRRESTHDTYAGPERGRDRDDYYDERRDHRPGERRGDFRGGPRGPLRGRGRGRGRWDDRDRNGDRTRDRDWDNPRRGRPSRSRSPPGRYGGRRDKPPYTPPPRPPNSRYADPPAVGEGAGSRAPEAGKDEFGRDIRPPSPDNTLSGSIRHSSADTHSPPTTRPSTHSPVDHLPPGRDAHSPRRDGPSSRPPPRGPPAAATQGGLDTFESASFDPTSPAAWTALGTAWQVTHGYLPSQEELMAYVLAGFGATSQFMAADGGQWAAQGHTYGGGSMFPQGGSWRGDAEMNGGGFHGSDSAYGNGRNVAYREEQAHEQDTPGLSSVPAGSQAMQPPAAGRGGSVDLEESMEGGSGTGRMQKVGDRWVFVRTAA